MREKIPSNRRENYQARSPPLHGTPRSLAWDKSITRYGEVDQKKGTLFE